MPFGQMIDVANPKSSQPGQQPGEGTGRLVNCYWNASASHYKASPGFALFVDTTLSGCRGFIVVGGILYACIANTVLTITENGVITVLSGSVSGTGPVTWAQNNKSPVPDVVLCNGTATYTVTPTTVTTFADPDWPSMKCVADLDGFIVGLTGSGQLWATDLNDITVNALSFTQCQSNPDGGKRVVKRGQELLVFGDASCETYRNAGTSPFPFAREQVISVGLLLSFGIAGYENGWDGQLFMIAADGTVRRVNGYTFDPVSNDDVNLAIQSIVNKEEIEACVHVVDGQPVVSFSSLSWTWEFNTTTGLWHERESYGLTRWRATKSVKFSGGWVVGDRESTKLFRLSGSENDEDGGAIVMMVESGATKQFPQGLRCHGVYYDWTTGQGSPLGNDDEVNPKVSISWSVDGGATWSNEITALSLGSQGQFNEMIRVNVNKRAGHHGIRFRVITSSPVYRTLRGARCDVSPLLS